MNGCPRHSASGHGSARRGLQRTATSRRPGAMLALGANTGVMLKYKGFEIDPHVSLDAMTLREEGYLEANGGPGFNLDVAPYFASSIRTALGADFKTKITMWNFELTPEARLGYRYDLLQQAVSGGVRGVLRKPYTVDKLLAILRDTSPAGLVLVAEDDPALGRHLTGLVSQAGYATALVTDGGTALATVEDRRIHVLVLDLKLPLIDGVGVYKELEAANRAVPTIIITGRGSGRSTRLAALDDVAVTGILNKPFDPALLLERLETLAA